MNLTCPFCKSETPSESLSCGSCRARLVKRCPYCAEEIQILARRCRFCASDLVEPSPHEAPAVRTLPGSTYVGEEQSIVLDLVLVVVTCGIWGLAAIHRIGTDLNRHAGREIVTPTMDIILILVTCGLWGIYLAYRYPTALNEIERAENVPGSDIMVICVVLTVVGIGFISTMIMQDQLNRHWRLHAGPQPTVAT